MSKVDKEGKGFDGNHSKYVSFLSFIKKLEKSPIQNVKKYERSSILYRESWYELILFLHLPIVEPVNLENHGNGREMQQVISNEDIHNRIAKSLQNYVQL